MHRCVFALGTDNIISTAKFHHAKSEKVVYQTFVATEILRGVKVKHTAMNDLISNQLMVNYAPQEIYRILNSVGISSSNNRIRLSDIKDGNEALEAGFNVDVKRWNMIVMAYNNCGFIRRGAVKVGIQIYI